LINAEGRGGGGSTRKWSDFTWKWALQWAEKRERSQESRSFTGAEKGKISLEDLEGRSC